MKWASLTDAAAARGTRERRSRSRVPIRRRRFPRGGQAVVLLVGLVWVWSMAAPPGPAAAGQVPWPASPCAAAGVDDEPDAVGTDDAWRVVVVHLDTGSELWSVPVRAGDEVWYKYTHSADKTPVQSLLRVEAPPVGLVLVLERYLWYGAGLEFRSDRGVALDGEWVVVAAERVVGRLPLRVAGTVEQEIVVGRRRTTLGQLAEFGERVMLEVRP